MNLYAGWRTEKGFDLHWDDQETMMLQISGRKRWKIFRPTRLHPLKNDIERAPEPAEEPIWDGILEDGDMIYLPRGWWHVAYPLDEPSLHLTFSMLPPTGIDVLQWLVGKLRHHEEVRMDVPRLDGIAAEPYVAGLRTVLNGALTDVVLARFLREWDLNVRTRPRISLPLAPIRQSAPITMDTHIRLATCHCLLIEYDDRTEGVYFHASGRRWSCSAAAAPALEALSDMSNLSVRDLCGKLASATTVTELKVMLTALAMAGVIILEVGAS